MKAIYVLSWLIVPILLTACAKLPSNNNTNMDNSNFSIYKRPGATPNIIFQSGLGDGKDTWSNVIARLPANYSLFAYDRPGYGKSAENTTLRTPCNISRELHDLLAHENVKPPYILVGHSIGGLYMYCFAKQYPNEVAGLVLLDPTHPQHWASIQEKAPVQAGLIKGLRVTMFSGIMRKEFDNQEACTNDLDLSKPVNAPALFLFSGKHHPEETGDFIKVLNNLRDNWLTLFTNSEAWPITNSGHYLQNDAPDKVVAAIEHVMNHVSKK